MAVCFEIPILVSTILDGDGHAPHDKWLILVATEAVMSQIVFVGFR